MKSEHQRRVETFMKLFGKPVPEKPLVPTLEIRRLCANLILEEALETIRELGFYVDVKPTECPDLYLPELKQRGPFKEDNFNSLIEIIDGCCDLIYVSTYCLSSCGVQDVEMQREVDENNILKAKGGAKIDPQTSKIIKPDNHPKPNLVKYLCGTSWY